MLKMLQNLLGKSMQQTVTSYLESQGLVPEKKGFKTAVTKLHKYMLKNYSCKNENDNILSIVFSKDRAMQLDAFLVSYIEQVSNHGPMIILYKCSYKRHVESYKKLFSLYEKHDMTFIEETDFRGQLIKIIDESNLGKVILYCDDMIFTHKIEYRELESINTNEEILALTRGGDLNYSVVLNRDLSIPPLTKHTDNLRSFRWDYFDYFDDWTYPLGTTGYLYSKAELLSMMNVVDFAAPNSLETSMQIFRPYFMQRKGLCTDFAICVCVHANLTQTEGENRVIGTFSIEELLDLWKQGKRINVSEFYNSPSKTTQFQAYTFS
jgi:hypothetical protein